MTEDVGLPSISTLSAPRPTLARLSFWTNQPDRLEAFYRDMFGFAHVALAVLGPDEPGASIVAGWKLPAGAAIRIAMLRAPRGATEIAIVATPDHALADAASVQDAPPQSGMTYAVLYVPDLDAVIQRCEAQGVAFNRAPKRLNGDGGLSYYEMAVYDPDGRVLLVVEDVKPAEGV